MPEERKLVTILFADVTGSTALADSLDPEDVRALMSRYYDHARRVITPRGGTLEKFIGDAVMAIFGLYQAHEDDAERALASALALREAVASDEILSPVFRLRIGVNTGEVIATNNPDRLDFLVTGDAVNVSARLQQGANPGEIIVSERTANATRKAFLFEEPRLLQAKGKPQPLQIFPLKCKRATRLVERHPFVGRVQDLRQLEILKERVLQERSSRVVSIVGQAGTGKSRLLEEFLTQIKPEEGLRVASAQCLPYGETLTYWPLRGLLTQLLGNPPEKEQVQAIYQQGGYESIDAARLADLIMTTLGMEEDGEKRERKAPSAIPEGLPSMPEGLRLNLSGAEARDVFASFNKRLIGNFKQSNALKRLGDLRNGTKSGKQTIGDSAKKIFNLDSLLELDGLDELVSLTSSSPGPKDGERLGALGEKLRVSGEALRDAINESVYSTLREVVPSRFLATDRESLFAAWRLLIELLARQAPRVVVFEDLHWVSDALLDLVEHIVQLGTAAPILFVILSRPELLERRASWRDNRWQMTVLTLEPLAEAETQELLERVQADVPDRIRRQIAERSGGNPFFTLELLRGYAERAQRGEVDANLDLPDTVHAAILARIDLLSRQERSLLQAASVSKRAFSRQLLMALMDEYELDAALDGLKSRNMLMALDEERYTFQHVLIRDVAYGTLARPERIRLHGKTALWLEDLSVQQPGGRDDYIELSAYHYRKAVELARQSAVPLALPFKTERAAQAFERAGLYAGRSGVFSEASCYLQLAIDLAPPSQHARLYEMLGESVSYGDISFEAYQKALASWRADTVRQPQVGARLIRKLLMEGTRNSLVSRFSIEEREALQREALALLEGTNDEDERWRIRLSECFSPQVCYSENDPGENDPARLSLIKEKRSLAEQAVNYFERRHYWEALSEALDAYGVLSISSHALPEALAAMERRLTIPDLPITEWADAVGSVVCCLFLMGDYACCITSVHETFANLKPGQPVARLGKVVSYGLLAAYLSGRWEEMEKLLSRLDEIHELVLYDPSASVQLARGYHAMLLMALAREDRALIDTLISKLLKDTLPHGEVFLSVIDAIVEDDVHKLPQERPAQVSDMLSVALLLFVNEHGFPLSEEMLGHVRDIGDGDRRLREIALALTSNDLSRLAHAIDEAEAHKLVHHAARMRIIMAERSHDPKPLALARPVLERLGDRQFLRRLEEVIK
ncbi:hypothetical protein KSC_011050 [Ktedonobacter sp. SOSP1-52]|uniref:adenylate/guanylate cyclase domain-containing protein n=1 Tax=Ktedonobacter sp. SOSP1-52 TaxID=2778366 RepID=UPI001915B7D0|nr:adenylate/guanylate cyclase domain-containing protein [Ktedonobacter sp. SOSP1-52]GHO62213.1 hypothetical protein KSC_011050 [Ktedonobacter sp. SOSP1-52]